MWLDSPALRAPPQEGETCRTLAYRTPSLPDPKPVGPKFCAASRLPPLKRGAGGIPKTFRRPKLLRRFALPPFKGARGFPKTPIGTKKSKTSHSSLSWTKGMGNLGKEIHPSLNFYLTY